MELSTVKKQLEPAADTRRKRDTVPGLRDCGGYDEAVPVNCSFSPRGHKGVPTLPLSIVFISACALDHILEVEVEHAGSEAVDQRGFPVVVFLVVLVAFMFFIAA